MGGGGAHCLHRWPYDQQGHAYYPAGPALTAAAEAEYARIAGANYLRGMERGAFVTELAERWGELNVVHSFREGNTRTQFAFFSQLCTQAGYRLATVLDRAVTAAPPPGPGAAESHPERGLVAAMSSVHAASFPSPPATRSPGSSSTTTSRLRGTHGRSEPEVGR